MKGCSAVLIAVLLTTTSCMKTGAMKTIQEVKRSHEQLLFSLPDVVSVGIGQDGEGSPVIVVGLVRDNPATRSQMPRQLEGYPVVIRVTGAPMAQ